MQTSQYFMTVNLKIKNERDNFFVIYKLKFIQKRIRTTGRKRWVKETDQ